MRNIFAAFARNNVNWKFELWTVMNFPLFHSSLSTPQTYFSYF